jgi:recombination protein RecA
MPCTAAIRLQIEAGLAHRIPSALTPAQSITREALPTGIRDIDELLSGGLPVGALSEIVGPECSGRTSLALSLVAQMTGAGSVCAWVDVSDSLHPESAAATGVNLSRLLWVRCGVADAQGGQKAERGFSVPEKYFVPPPVRKGLHGGGFGPHPRSEVKGLSEAVSGFFHAEMIGPRCAEPQARKKPEKESVDAVRPKAKSVGRKAPYEPRVKPWERIEEALRVTDLLLQAGGFSAIVMDMGGIAPEYASRVPLATWFRYRAAVERSHAVLLLLTQHPCAKSSAGLVLRLEVGNALEKESTVFFGMEYHAEVVRERFIPAAAPVVPMRKPPQSERSLEWHSRTCWTGR